ncbi:MAG: hypothetical protein EAZ28_02240 [Oscillatoriales cyanobacterium]|nr:MAG: hypothetical protein EAZ28_02240 [Oscillatoriales cyanobacterium]
MKKFQVLAGIASTVAIASSIAIGDPASAFPCFYKKSGGGGAQSGSGPTIVGSGGSDQMNPWKSNKTVALGFLGLAGILGGGAAYMSYRAGQRASAACDAMSDNFEVFEEHPEAPGGELDLPVAQVAEVSSESAIEPVESAIV